MISYAKLWQLLKRRGYAPRDIIQFAGISESTYQKLVKTTASAWTCFIASARL